MFRTSLFALPTMVLLSSGTSVLALTADEVWTGWKESGQALGLAVSAATESNSGGVLTLNGITMTPGGAPTGLTISDMTLTENGDGTVTIRPGAAIGAAFSEGVEGFTLSLQHQGLELTAYEAEGGGIAYDFFADKADIVFDATSEGFSFTDQPAQPVKNAGSFGFSGLEGSYADRAGANRTFDLSLIAATLAYDTLSDDPNLQLKSTSTSVTTDVELAGQFVLPSTIKLGEMDTAAQFGQALQEGLAVSFAIKQGASNGTASAEDEFAPFDMKIAGLPGNSAVRFDKDAFAVTTSVGGMTLDITTPMVPAPVQVTSGPLQMDILSPIMSGDTAADYRLLINWQQFSLNEAIWGLFDPGAALQREPFDLTIDISGKAKVDWVAMAVADESGAVPPVPQPETLDITSIAARLAGAAINATGAFTFDNSPGFPMPLGSADVAVSGASQLIDGLISIGLLTPEDAMGARMMMGAFMVPGAEPDSLTTKIEAKEGFQILVNGQPLPM
jgi:hypothetical protein